MNTVEYISRRYTNGKGDVNELGTVFGSPVNGMKNEPGCCEWPSGGTSSPGLYHVRKPIVNLKWWDGRSDE